MPTWIYSVKSLIPVIAFTLCFLLLDLVITTSDPNDIYMNCSDVTVRCIKSHLYHVVFISTCNVFYPLYVRFYHCTAYAVHFHCLHVCLLRVTLNINQSAVALNATQRRSLSHTWQYVVSKAFHITRDNVSFVCNVTEAVPFCEFLIHRNVTFLKNLQKFNSQHLVIGYLVRHSGN